MSLTAQAPTSPTQRLSAILQALFIAFLWATSWVLIKFGLEDIPPLVFAGVRYFLAFLILLFVFMSMSRRNPAPLLPRRLWGRVALFGMLLYTVAQGAMFVALKYLPAVTLNLILNFNNLGTALLGAIWLSERPSALQWTGILLALVGALIYFLPVNIPQAQWYGIAAAVVCLAANILAVTVGRELNSSRLAPPLLITLVSMGIGSAALLSAGLFLEGIPTISLRNAIFILWLAAVNTAFAFTLWNHTLRTLTAAESSICTGTMMIWIPI
ncbi:MAG TPA: DMT family transporter, partial [Anaerolineales bacterium]|nr:DMT family transporter [Anaerolineales bacterium]